MRTSSRFIRCWLLLTVLVMILSRFLPEVGAEDHTTAPDAVLQRLDQLERDNQALRETVSRIEQERAAFVRPGEPSPGTHADGLRTVLVHAPALGTISSLYQPTDPRAVFPPNGLPPLLNADAVPGIAARTSEQREENQAPAASEVSPADSRQDQRIADVDRNLRQLEERLAKKNLPSLTVNGVFQADAGWIHQDTSSESRYGQIQDGADFRRARLSAKGSVTEQTNYFFQMDFGFFGRPTFTDVWLEQTNVPVLGNVRIGQWKQPFSLEVVSSFRYTTFMERSLLFQPFTPFRHLGIGFYDYSDDQSHTWAASAFRTGQDQFGATLSSDGGYGTAERLTWLTAWENGGKDYLHLGIGHFFNSPPDDTVNFRTIPEFFVGANGPGAVGTSGQAVPGGSNGTPFFVATGNLEVPFYNVLGGELLWVRGPLSVQSETMVNQVQQTGGSTAVFLGSYVQTGYFLTGEHRPYDRRAGAIDRVIPNSSLAFSRSGCHEGTGAWEVAARWSFLDLNDAAIRGGTLTDYTAGINWYWNPYTKMVFNYVHAISGGTAAPTAHSDLFGLRAQIDF